MKELYAEIKRMKQEIEDLTMDVATFEKDDGKVSVAGTCSRFCKP